MAAGAPVLSVLVVSDYGGGAPEEWDYLRDVLRALARQAQDQPDVEIILADATPEGQKMPADVASIVPSLRIIRGTSSTRELLNDAVDAASADLVALLDGDCTISPGWLHSALEAMRRHPDAAAVSGRTTYPGASFRDRVLATLSRSFLDPGGAGPTRFSSSNNAIFRRDALLAHPLQAFPRTLAARLQSEAIRLDGGAFYFEPGMLVTHRFDGWPMERRIRRRAGYRTIKLRQLDPRVPHTWMLRLGALSIPFIIASRTIDSWWNCLRVGRFYGIRWFEMPAAFATAIYVHLLEIGGMRAAFADEAMSERACGPVSVPAGSPLKR